MEENRNESEFLKQQIATLYEIRSQILTQHHEISIQLNELSMRFAVGEKQIHEQIIAYTVNNNQAMINGTLNMQSLQILNDSIQAMLREVKLSSTTLSEQLNIIAANNVTLANVTNSNSEILKETVTHLVEMTTQNEQERKSTVALLAGRFGSWFANDRARINDQPQGSDTPNNLPNANNPNH